MRPPFRMARHSFARKVRDTPSRRLRVPSIAARDAVRTPWRGLVGCLLGVLLLLTPAIPSAAEAAATGSDPIAATARDTYRESALISPHPADATDTQKAAEDEKSYRRLRELAISGDHASAQRGLIELLGHDDLVGPLRMRVFVTAISLATNYEDWPAAFTLLNEAMALAPSVPEESARLLGAASQLYAAVGESERAIDLGLRAVDDAQSNGDKTQMCHAISALAIAYESENLPNAARQWRARQIDACGQAGEPTFEANGMYGLGKALGATGEYEQALEWAEASLRAFEQADFEAGANNARVLIAQSLIQLGRDLPRADALLAGLANRRPRIGRSLALAEVEQLRATLAETRGDHEAALAHLKDAMRYSVDAERSARKRQLAYLQLEFDSRHKENQISLLQTEKSLAEANATAARRRQLLLATGLAGLLVSAGLLLLLLRRTLRDRRRYRWEAEHDGLTGLINQQHLGQLGEAAFARAMEAQRPITAIAVDIDLFKQINDSHGHAAGDEALRSLGAWMREAVGDRGIAARRGGDEFMILLDGNAAQAKDVVRNLRERIVPLGVHNRTVAFTISAGLCQADARTRGLQQLMHQADKALYRAKRQGRDRLICWNDEVPEATQGATVGSLVVVGSGIQFGRHVSERTLSEIQQAQVVFCLADPFTLAMVTRLRPDTINLGAHYAAGRDRRETYRDIDAAIMAEVRAGKAVCAVFYGHPGVFADVPHQVIRKTRAEGLSARMEPGISAEACLYADLGIDPGQRGIQSLEATHFLCFDRQIDPQGPLLLWQVALVGDWTCSRLESDRECLEALVAKLLRWYPPDHEVILYEAAQLPVGSFRADRMRLCDLPDARYTEVTTLVIPPLATELRRDPLCEAVPA